MQRIFILLLFLSLTAYVAGQNEEGSITSEESVESLYICECSEEKLLGKYNIVRILVVYCFTFLLSLTILSAL